MFFMSFLGYLGAMRESRCLLSTVSDRMESVLEVWTRTHRQSVSKLKVICRSLRFLWQSCLLCNLNLLLNTIVSIFIKCHVDT